MSLTRKTVAALAVLGTVSVGITGAAGTASASPARYNRMVNGTTIMEQPDPNSKILGYASRWDAVDDYDTYGYYDHVVDEANEIYGWVPWGDIGVC